MKIICINPPKFLKCFLRLFAKNKKTPVVDDGRDVREN